MMLCLVKVAYRPFRKLAADSQSSWRCERNNKNDGTYANKFLYLCCAVFSSSHVFGNISLIMVCMPTKT